MWPPASLPTPQSRVQPKKPLASALLHLLPRPLATVCKPGYPRGNEDMSGSPWPEHQEGQPLFRHTASCSMVPPSNKRSAPTTSYAQRLQTGRSHAPTPQPVPSPERAHHGSGLAHSIPTRALNRTVILAEGQAPCPR